MLFPVTNELDAQTAMALTPLYESLGSIEPLLLGDTGAGNGGLAPIFPYTFYHLTYY
ncbi:hypothetical protein ACZ87_04038, partial [Candidatus Erwinia dacicola]